MDSLQGVSQSINNSTSNIQQTIAIKVLKDALNRQQEMINTLISSAPVSVNPKSGNSTFEVII